MCDEDFMTHVLNNLSKDYNVILNGLENCLMATRDDVLTTYVIREKLNYWYKKLKKRTKTEKEKASGAYKKQYKQRCCKCGNYGHKPEDKICSENRKEKEEK